MRIYELGLETLEAGAVVEAANLGLAKVFEDLINLDKVESAPRAVVIKITVKPNAGSALAPTVSTSVQTKLAPYRPIEGTAYLDVRDDGTVVASQVDPEQQQLPLGEPEAVNPAVAHFPEKKEELNGQ